MLPDGLGLGHGFVGGVLNGLLGNSIAGYSDLYDQVTGGKTDNGMGNVYGGQLVGGATQGIPIQVSSAGAKGPLGVFLGYASEGVQNAALNIGRAKFAMDIPIYLEALQYCYTGKY